LDNIDWNGVLSTTSKKCIGIIGGLSPESTTYYYQYITREYTNRCSDYSYPEIIIYSVDFQKYIDWGSSGNWGAVEDDLVKAIGAISKAGAEFGIIATNTMHYVFDSVQSRVDLPLISLVDEVAKHVKNQGITKIGLLGTKLTMSKQFYPKALESYGIETLVPNQEDQKIVHEIIFKELTKGIIKLDSKAKYIDIINELSDFGAQGVILGCTEIPLLIKDSDIKISVIDSSLVHAKAALDFALRDE
jgi:aspartate racemase